MQKVLLTYDALFHGPQPQVELMKQAGFDVAFATGKIITEADTIAALQGVVAVMAGGEPYTEKVFQALPDLRVVARAGVGYDRVDLAAATKHHVVVTITPTANYEAVAEHAMALLLAATRQIALRDREMREGVWTRSSYLPMRGKTLGILGLGRIGRAVAVRAAAFRMKIVAHEPFPDQNFVQAHGIELLGIEDVLKRSDYLSLHLPLSAETRGFMNADRFRSMKPGSFLVNTSRGGLVVEKDLLAALQSGHLAGAGLDVFEQEPTPRENPLLRLENVVVSPHMAGGDTQSVLDMGREAAENILHLWRGQWPESAVVNPAVRSTWKWTR